MRNLLLILLGSLLLLPVTATAQTFDVGLTQTVDSEDYATAGFWAGVTSHEVGLFSPAINVFHKSNWNVWGGTGVRVVEHEDARLDLRLGVTRSLEDADSELEPTVGFGVRSGGEHGIVFTLDRARHFTTGQFGLYLGW